MRVVPPSLILVLLVLGFPLWAQPAGGAGPAHPPRPFVGPVAPAPRMQPRSLTVRLQYDTLTSPGGGFFPAPEPKRPRLALVLSGGGARGAAQIGVLKAFERHKIPIDFIAATSMGAIIGG